MTLREPGRTSNGRAGVWNGGGDWDAKSGGAEDKTGAAGANGDSLGDLLGRPAAGRGRMEFLHALQFPSLGDRAEARTGRPRHSRPLFNGVGGGRWGHVSLPIVSWFLGGLGAGGGGGRIDWQFA